MDFWNDKDERYRFKMVDVYNEQKLEKANNKTKELDDITTNINEILDNLKPTKLNKNNMVISNEDVQKIKNHTEDVKEYY